MSDLPLYWENETHFACHAYFPPECNPMDKNFNIQRFAGEVLWDRFPRDEKTGSLKLINPPVWPKIGVFGHTPMEYYKAAAPIKYHKIRLIDTGAFDDEYLCGYCCEEDNWILQATIPKDIGKK